MSLRSPNWVLCILVLINMSAYVDRYALAGLLEEVTKEHLMTETQKGFLQTSFIFCYLVGSMIFGFLGRKADRMRLLVIGCLIWSCANILGIMVPSGEFWLFALTRGFVGAGESSITTLGAVLIADLYVERNLQVTIFYLATPIGGGLGYILSSQLHKYFGFWRVALVITPIICIMSAFYLWFVKDPRKKVDESEEGSNTLGQSMHAILTNKSLWANNLGCACISFGGGALSWWAPNYLSKAFKLHDAATIVQDSRVSTFFGWMSLVAGILGNVTSYGFEKLLKRCTDKSQVVGAAIALLCSPAFFLVAIFLATSGEALAWINYSLGHTIFSMHLVYVANILLDTVPSVHRTSAIGFQICFSHLLGDVISPTLLGGLAEIGKGSQPTQKQEVYALRNALAIAPGAYLLGGFCFVVLLCFYTADVRRCQMEDNKNGEGIPMKDYKEEIPVDNL